MRKLIAAGLLILAAGGCSRQSAAQPTEANKLPTVAPVSRPVTTKPKPPRPMVTITCHDSYPGRVTFGGEWEVHTRTARLSIDYGDGKRYQTRRLADFNSAYWHDYRAAGTYLVRIVLTDGAEQTDSDACTLRVHSRYNPPPIVQPYDPPDPQPPTYQPPSYQPRTPGGSLDHDWPSNPGPGSNDPSRPIQPYPAAPGDPNDRDGDGVACEFGCKN